VKVKRVDVVVVYSVVLHEDAPIPHNLADIQQGMGNMIRRVLKDGITDGEPEVTFIFHEPKEL
jgi:hypothetical protein